MGRNLGIIGWGLLYTSREQIEDTLIIKLELNSAMTLKIYYVHGVRLQFELSLHNF